MDYSLLGSSIHGIFQARILEWVAISFSRRSQLFKCFVWWSHKRNKENGKFHFQQNKKTDLFTDTKIPAAKRQRRWLGEREGRNKASEWRGAALFWASEQKHAFRRWEDHSFFCNLVWTILTVFIEFVTMLFLFYVSAFWLQGMWEPSSLTRDWTCPGLHWKVKSQPLDLQESLEMTVLLYPCGWAGSRN